MNKKQTKKRIIEPQYLYGADNKPAYVYLSIEDYEAFMEKLERFSKKAQACAKKSK